MLEATQAAQSGDAARSVELIRQAAALGRDHFYPLLFDTGLAPIAQDPLFRELIHELAGRYVELIQSRDYPTQAELAALATAHFERSEFDEAEEALERAVERGGLAGERFAGELDGLRSLRAEIEAAGRLRWNPGGSPGTLD
jgi:tetratricopeptide (TPR) repeat protein